MNDFCKTIYHNNKKYIFWSNERKAGLPIIIAIYKKLKIDAIYIDNATDIIGNKLKDYIEVYIKENDYNSTKMDKAIQIAASERIWPLYRKGTETVCDVLQ